MWRKEYLTCIKSNLFIIMQICLALVLINEKVGYIAWKVEDLSSIENTDEGTYFLQYAMAAGGLFDPTGNYTETCEKIKSLPGIKEMGEVFNTSISVVGGSVNKMEENEWIQLNAMDSIVTAAVTYRMKEGRWLNEGDRQGDVIHAVLGGDIAKKHKIGDRILVELDSGKKYETVVVGKLPENCRTFDMHVLMTGQNIDSFMQPCKNDIFINHQEVFGDAKKSGFGHSTAHCIVKLKKDADKNYLSGYGKIVSLEEMEQETERELHDFIKEAVEENMLWAVVIIFGIIATSYMVGKKRRYAWGIYLLLGEKPERLLKMQMLHNIVNYIVSVILSLWIYQKFLMDETFSTDVGRYHIIVDVVFILIMVVVSLLSNAYIMKLEPKEILTQVKE